MKTASETAFPASPEAAGGFNVWRIREDFPILRRQAWDKPLVYLDNAATTQKPQAVIDAITSFYTSDCANIHRGVHFLSERATDAYEESRAKVRRFLNARDTREIIFVRGATEGINLVARSFVRPMLKEGDEVLITAMEHHANIVPWQMVCGETGARLRVAPIDDRGELIIDEFEKLLGPRTRFVAVSHVSNALGTINPAGMLVEMARSRKIPVLVDGAQAVPHMNVDVQALGCDFYVFSAHKLYGPTGIGALYGRAELLEAMPPYQGGGDMIASVTFEKTVYNQLPWKFEAGTPNIAGTIGLGAAIDYVSAIGLDAIAAHEHGLLAHATGTLSSIPGLKIIGTAHDKAAVISFILDGVHPHDVGTILDREGVAVRVGHHCAQPVMQRFGVPATSRASFAMYNTSEEVEALTQAVYKVKEIFG
ncbi:MAG TPA: cysteine desulfurase [Bryobacteraceae bacterium]|nr:cysteine desulfurase [Bryobacteraceae bacterium]